MEAANGGYPPQQQQQQEAPYRIRPSRPIRNPYAAHYYYASQQRRQQQQQEPPSQQQPMIHMINKKYLTHFHPKKVLDLRFKEEEW
eukprot:scaffold17843_cov93-Cylindrotheca_fusiformis.AAC.1